MEPILQTIFTAFSGLPNAMEQYSRYLDLALLALCAVLFLRGVTLARWTTYRASQLTLTLLLLAAMSVTLWLVVNLFGKDTVSLALNGASSFLIVLLSFLCFRQLPGFLLTMKALTVLTISIFLALPVALQVGLKFSDANALDYRVAGAGLAAVTLLLVGLFYKLGRLAAGLVVGLIASTGGLFFAERLGLMPIDLSHGDSFLSYYRLGDLWPSNVFSALLSGDVSAAAAQTPMSGIGLVHLVAILGAVVSAAIQFPQERNSMNTFVSKHYYRDYPQGAFGRFLFELGQVFTFEPSAAKQQTKKKPSEAGDADTENHSAKNQADQATEATPAT